MEAITRSDAEHALVKLAAAVAAREAELNEFKDDGERTETDEETDTP